jgi:hypothetical protein
MRTPINKKTYLRLRAIADKETEFIRALGKNWLDAEDRKRCTEFCGGKLTNKDRSNIEVYEWLKNPPQSYFVYISEKEWDVVTWTGQKLGKVWMGSSYKSNFGDMRRSIDVIGTNGVKYYGTYFCSAGDYARIKAYKKA